MEIKDQKNAAAAYQQALAGLHFPYDGALLPSLGEAQWDDQEGVWAVRLQEFDEPFPCGVECCGYAGRAVVAVE